MTFQLMEETLGSCLEKEGGVRADQDFIIYPDRDLRFTYSSFNKRVDNLAKGFLEIGLK